MGNTKSTKQKKEQGKQQANPVSSVSVGIPIRVTIIVPVELEGYEVDTSESFGDVAGVPVIDCTKYDNGGDVLVASIEAAEVNDACKDAVASLLAATQLHRKQYPTHQATLSTYAGILEEMEI